MRTFGTVKAQRSLLAGTHAVCTMLNSIIFLAQQSPELAGVHSEILIGMLGAKSPKLAGFRFAFSTGWCRVARFD